MTTDKSSRWCRFGASAEKILLVDLAQLLFPEPLFVHDVFRVDDDRHTTSQVFDTFARRATFDRRVVAMSFRVSLLNQRQPSLVRLAVGEIECFAAALQRIFQFVFFVCQSSAFFLVAVPVSHNPEFVVVADAHVQLVVDDFVYPFTICSALVSQIPQQNTPKCTVPRKNTNPYTPIFSSLATHMSSISSFFALIAIKAARNQQSPPLP